MKILKGPLRVFFTMICLLSLTILSSSLLSALTTLELQEKILLSNSSLESAQLNYLQEIRSTLTPEIHHSFGTLYLEKPSNLRIEQVEPEEQSIISSGKNVFIYTPRFKQVIKYSRDRWFSESPLFSGILGFLKNFQKFKSEYRWEMTGDSEFDGEEVVGVHLQALSKEAKHSINLWISKSDFIPRKVELVFDTSILATTFTSLQKNPKLRSDLFQFVQPPGTEVIKMP